MKLPAFLLSKIVSPDPIRGPDFRRGVLLSEDLGCSWLTTAKKLPVKYKTRRQAPGTATFDQWLYAMLNMFLTCANKAPHYRICSLDYFRPDCESLPLHGPVLLRKPRTICNLTIATKYVKSFTKLFCSPYPHPCGCCE